MASYFDLFVLYGIPPTFYVNGSKQFYTLFSQIASFFSIFLIIFFSVYCSLELLNRKNPQITRTVYVDEYPNPINLSKNFIFTFSLQYQNYTNYVNESIYSVSASYTQTKVDNDGNTIEKNTPISITTCDKININILKDYFHTLSLENLYCLENPDELILEGDFGRSYWNYLTFRFNFCNNNKNCEEKSKIIDMLKGGYFGMFISDIIVQPLNYKKPVIYNGINQYTTISSLMYKDFWVYFRTNEIKTDSNLLFESHKKEVYYGFDKSFEHTDMRDIESNFMTMIVRASSDRYVYSRTYKKFASVIADIAGMMKFIFLLGDSLVYFFENVYYKFYLFSFFDIKISDKLQLLKFPSRKYYSNAHISNYNRDTEKNKRENINLFMSDVAKSTKIKNQLIIPEEMSDNINLNEVNSRSNSEINGKQGLNFKNHNNKSQKNYTKFLNCFSIINIILCKYNKKIINQNIEEIYNNILIYFEIIRFFKLYNDVEEVKKVVFNFEQFNFMDNNYFFSLNNEKTINNFNNNFQSVFNKKANFKTQISNITSKKNQSIKKLVSGI